MGIYYKSYGEFVNEGMDDKKYRIFCDMDGVLSNFVKRFQELESNAESLAPNEYDAKHGKWSIWQLVDKEGVEWWSGMEWMPDGQKLWHWLIPYSPTILSAPSKHPDSREGKLRWINSHLGIKQKFYTINPKKWRPGYRIIFNKDKYKFTTGPTDILIDDTPEKIRAWQAEGGTGILHTSANDTINQLKKIMY